MCVFEFCNATNTFLKVWIKCILGGFRMYLSKVALAINLKKKNEKRKVQIKKNGLHLVSIIMFTMAFIAAVLTRGS